MPTGFPADDIPLPAEPDPRWRRAAMLIAAFGVLGVIAGAVLVYTGVGASTDIPSAGALTAYGLYVGLPALVALVLTAGLLRGWRWSRWGALAFTAVAVLLTAFATVTLNGDVAFPFAPFLLWLPADREVARLFLAIACASWGFALYLLCTASADAGRPEPDEDR